MSNFDKLEPEDEIEILKCSRDAWEADAKRYAANADYWRERDANDLAALTAARAALAHQERKVRELAKRWRNVREDEALKADWSHDYYRGMADAAAKCADQLCAELVKDQEGEKNE